jgi:hypothetical protein
MAVPIAWLAFDMHLYTARSKISEANLGDTDAHLARIGKPLAP